MRFLVDQSLPPRLAVLLTEAGHDAVHVRDTGLSDATDIRVMEAAALESRVVLTADTDLDGAVAMSPDPASVLVVRRVSQRRAADLAELLIANLGDIEETLAHGALVVLEERSVRVRRYKEL